MENLQLIYTNSALEIQKQQWNNPIRIFPDDSLFYPIQLTQTKHTNIYLRQSFLEMSKGWASMGSNEYTYHNVVSTREYSSTFEFPKIPGDETKLNRIFIRLEGME